MCTKDICGQVLIATLNRHLNQHLEEYFANTQSTTPLTLNQQSTECQPTHMYWLTLDGMSAKINQLFEQLLTKMSIKFWSSVNQGVNQVLIKFRSSVNRGYWLRLSIDTRLWMALVHMIQELIGYCLVITCSPLSYLSQVINWNNIVISLIFVAV